MLPQHWPEDMPQTYLRLALLREMQLSPRAPPPPAPRSKSHKNLLKVSWRPFRYLRAIMRVQEDSWRPTFLAFRDATPNSRRPDDSDLEGECVTVPALSQFQNPRTRDEADARFSWMIPDHILRQPHHIGNVALWVDEGPLRTIQRICHITIPETHDFNWWNYDEVEGSDPDRDLMRVYGWARQQPFEEPDGRMTIEPLDPSMLVFVQPPWILSSRDMLQFYKCKELPKMERPLISKERLWGKIWDECLLRNCSWFVLTNYHEWTFGTFSSAREAALVMKPKAYDTLYPTVPEILNWWLASSMQAPNAFTPDTLMEDPRRQAPALLSRRRNELQAERQRIVQQGLYIDPTPSDSEWNSDDEDQFSYSQASDISFASTTGTFTPGLLRDVPAEQRADVLLPEPQEHMPLAGRTRGARSRQASTAGGGGAPLTGQTLEWLNQTNGVAEPPRRLESVSSFASSNGASIVASPSATGASAGAGWLQSSSTFGLAPDVHHVPKPIYEEEAQRWLWPKGR